MKPASANVDWSRMSDAAIQRATGCTTGEIHTYTRKVKPQANPERQANAHGEWMRWCCQAAAELMRADVGEVMRDSFQGPIPHKSDRSRNHAARKVAIIAMKLAGYEHEEIAEFFDINLRTSCETWRKRSQRHVVPAKDIIEMSRDRCAMQAAE